MKRVISLLLTMVLLLSVIPTVSLSAHAQAQAIVFSTSTVSKAAVGDIITVDVNVSENHYMVNGQLWVEYDATALEIQHVCDDDENPYFEAINTKIFKGSYMWAFAVANAGCAKLVFATSSSKGTTVGGTMFTLTFKVLKTVGSDTAIKLVIPEVGANDGGDDFVPKYSCVGSKIAVQKQVAIKTNPKSTSVAKGKTAKVTVEATGDGLTYQWYVKEPGKSTYKALSGATKVSYSFIMKDAYSGRSFYCLVKDSYGNSVKSAVAVIDQKVTIKTQPKAGAFTKGKTAKVTVAAVGAGLKYKWYVKEPGKSSYKAISTATKSSYSFTMKDAYSGRSFYCVVTDKHGNTAKSTAVVLDQKVTIKTQPKAGVFAKGKTVKVTVAAVGAGLKYKWYVKEPGAKSYKAISSAAKATYTFTMKNAYSGRSLYCVVTDKHGNTVKSKAVTVDQKVTIATQPKSVTVAKNKTAKVTVAAVGAGLKYKWYVKEAGAKSFKAVSTKTASYSAKMTAKNSGRQVYCVITDKYGNTVKTKTVTLKAK